MKKEIITEANKSLLGATNEILGATVYTIPQQTIVVPETKIKPTFTTIDHANGQVSLQFDVVDAQGATKNRTQINFPISELNFTVQQVEDAAGASVNVVNAIKAAIQKL